MRVAVVVADADRDQRRARTGCTQQRGTAARVRPVVTDLQHVDRPQQPALGEHRLDGSLGIAAEQRAEAAAAQQHDDRRVVDIAVGKRPGHIVGARIEEGQDGRGVEANALPGARRHEPSVGLGARQLLEPGIGRVRIVASGVQDQPHLVALQRRQQAGHMVLVRVGEDHHVDAPMPPGKSLAQPPKEEIRIGSAVDQRGGAGRRGHQDRVALPDVEDHQVDPPIRQRSEGEGAEQQPQPGKPDRWPRDCRAERAETREGRRSATRGLQRR